MALDAEDGVVVAQPGMTVWRFDRVGREAPLATLDRHSRTGVRIALRQLKAAGTVSPMLKAWLAEFDHTAVEDDADEAVLQHAH